MKVIILCGGIGTRLKEETEYKPKAMVHIGGKPLIWHIMKIYSQQGFSDFILALGYKADYIKDFFLNQQAYISDFSLDTKTYKVKYYLENRKAIDEFNITFVDTGLETLTGSRILQCEKYIPKEDNDLMITYGDGVSNVNIKDVLKMHLKYKKTGTITGVHPRSKYGLLRIDNDNLVSYFEEKPILSDYVNGGFMVFNRKVFDYMKHNEMDTEALKHMAADKELALYKHDGFWFAIDTYKELEDLNKIWNSGNPPWKIWE